MRQGDASGQMGVTEALLRVGMGAGHWPWGLRNEK